MITTTPAIPKRTPLKLHKASRDEGSHQPPWKVLIVDDEPEVHSVTRLALHDFTYDDRKLQFISAHSGREACEILDQETDIALMLLDVVMETDDAGLRVVEYLRHQLGNAFMRVVLRTGHPGMAPERHVIRAFDINDYRAKTELTQDRMYSLVYTALSSYKRLNSLASSQRYLRSLAEEYHSVLDNLQSQLRLPIAGVRSALAQLNQDLTQDHTAIIQQLEHSLTQLGDTAHGIARLSELNQIDKTDTYERISGESVVESALDKLDPALRQRIQTIHYQHLPTLIGQPALLIELFQQLIANAVTHHPDQANIEIRARPRGTSWECTISDDGPGIAMDEWELVFDAFHGKDLGIGLTICRKIVAAHGGKICVRPSTNGGAAIQLTLPAGTQPD